MDPINIIAGLNLLATFGANISGAKKGLRSTITAVKVRPKSYLQKFPLALATISLAALVLGIFQVGTIEYKPEYQSLRMAGLLIYIVFSWVQVWSYKTLGENYSQEIVIFKEHQLIQKGAYKIIRHPQYLSQFFADLGAGLAVLSYIVLPIALIQIPFLILRAKLEEGIMQKHFNEEYSLYKKKTGFLIPFIG